MESQVQPTPPSQPPQEPVRYGLSFHGDGLGLALIVLKNILLTIGTIGIYSFWGKVNVRRYLWQSSEFHGQRLGYHGTGGELLRGYAKIVGLVLAYYGLAYGAMMISPIAYLALMGVSTPIFLVLAPYAIYQSQRYLYSRTSWRGIRFGMGADPWPFVKAFIKGYLLSMVTFGFYLPVFQNSLYRLRMDNGRIGSLAMRYTGKDEEVFKIFLAALPLIVVTLGIYLPWYSAKISRYRASHTWIGGPSMGAAHGQLVLEGGEYFGLILVNLLCILATVGLAMPWVIAHNMSFFLKRFSFIGNVELDQIVQVASSGSAAADDLAGALHVGFGI